MKAAFTLFLKEVKRNIGSFLIIALTVFLAVAVASGMLCYAINFAKSAENYFDQNKMWDIKITSTLGFTREDVIAVGSAKGVQKASAVIAADTNCSVNGVGNFAAKICGIDFDAVAVNPDNTVAAPRLVKGSYPSNANSCVVVVSNALKSDIKVGDVVLLNSNTGYCTQTDFTVTGIVYSPEYTSYLKDGNIVNDTGTQMVIFTRSDAFAPEAQYTEINILFENSAALKSFSSDYQVFVNTAMSDINIIARGREQIRGNDLGDEYQSNIDKLQKQYDYIKSEGEKEVKELTEIIKSIKKKAEETDAALLTRKVALDAKKAALDALAGSSEYAKLKEEYNREIIKYNSDKESNDMNKATAENIEKDIEKINKSTAKKLEDAQKKIDAAKSGKPIDSVQKWSLHTREENLGFKSVADNNGKIAAMFFIISILLLVLASGTLFVSVNRMIERRKKEIGIMKTAGCSNKTIVLRVMPLYLAAGILGSVIGISLSVSFIPKIIHSVVGMLYNIPVGTGTGAVLISFIIAVLLIAVIVAIGILTFIKLFKLSPSQLLYGETEHSTDVLPVLSEKIPSALRLILRNLLRHKGNFITAAGCVALITVLTLSVLNISTKPSNLYKNQTALHRYDVSVDLNPYTDFTQNEEMSLYLKDKEYIPVLKTSFSFSNNPTSEYITAFVPTDAEKFGEFVRLKKSDFNENSVIITSGFAKKHNISVGDTIDVFEKDDALKLTVTDITKNYIGEYLYIHPEKYAELKGAGAVADTLLIKNLDSSPDLAKLYNTSVIYSVETFEKADHVPIKSFTNRILYPTLIIGTTLLYFIMNSLYSARQSEIKALLISGYGILRPVVYFAIETAVVWFGGAILGIILSLLANLPIALLNLQGVNLSPYISFASVIKTLLITFGISFSLNAAILIIRQKRKNRR